MLCHDGNWRPLIADAAFPTLQHPRVAQVPDRPRQVGLVPCALVASAAALHAVCARCSIAGSMAVASAAAAICFAIQSHVRLQQIP